MPKSPTFSCRFRPTRLSAIAALALLPTGFPAMADVAISRQDCDWLLKYRQPAGVEYQPGVDAHGQPVAPADIGGGTQLQLPDTIVIPIEVLLQDRFHLPANSVLWEGKAQVGTVVVQGDQIYYNGQPLQDSEAAALEAICQERKTGQ